MAEVTARRARTRAVLRLLLIRTAIAVPVLLVVSVALFALASLSPFDPLATYLGANYQSATASQREAARIAYGLDAPWWSAWWSWLTSALHLDLGWSATKSAPVAAVIGERLPFTLALSFVAVAIAAVASVVLGSVAGMRPGGIVDRAVTVLATICAATPPFVVSLVLVAVFAVGLRALPTSGARAPGEPYTAAGLIAHSVLPVLALTISQMPWLVLSMRTAVVDAAGSDAVRGARARGVHGRRLLTGHVAPVSVLPTLALLGTRLPEVIAGAAVVEAVFSWPGVADALVESAVALDFPLLASLSLTAGAAVLAGSALSDAAALWLDPRIEITA